MSEIKTLGVLTSGGDAPGMNAAVRSVVRSSIHHGIARHWNPEWIYRTVKFGYDRAEFEEVSDTLHRGGTFLGKCQMPEFKQPEMVKKSSRYRQSQRDGRPGGDRRRRLLSRSTGFESSRTAYHWYSRHD